MDSVVIGIAAKNEEASIYSCLESVNENISQLPKNTRVEIVVCLNNCTDCTEAEVIRFKRNHGCSVTIVRSTGNLISAQRQIYKLAKGTRMVFVDADLVLEKNTVKLLLRTLEDSKVVLSYAESKLMTRPKKLVEKVYFLYSNQLFLTPRYYFHGRCFATKVWDFPSKSHINKISKKSPYLLKYGNGLVADDVYLSAHILNAYGPLSIKSVPGAFVRINSIRSWKDWWLTYRRTTIEVKKITAWFTEFKDIEKYLYRKVDWKAWRRGSPSQQLYWVLYLLLKTSADIVIGLEMLAVRFLGYTPPRQWIPAATTKQVPLRKLILVDIDGTIVENGVHLYQDSGIKSLVADAMDQGSSVGILTHRSYNSSLKIYEQLRLNGPLLVEGGADAYVEHDKKLNKVQLYDAASPLPAIQRAMKIYTRDLNVKISTHRHYSAVIEAYDNSKAKDMKILKKYLRGQLARYGLKVEADEGNVFKLHVFYKKISKSFSAQTIQKRYYPGHTVTIVGDNESNRRVRGMRFLGTHNANQTYKKICDHVSSHSGVKGLYELLEVAND